MSWYKYVHIAQPYGKFRGTEPETYSAHSKSTTVLWKNSKVGISTFSNIMKQVNSRIEMPILGFEIQALTASDLEDFDSRPGIPLTFSGEKVSKNSGDKNINAPCAHTPFRIP
jgi:hypothetical protein